MPGIESNDHGHLRVGPAHAHAHHHAPASPHPSQPAPWSILRMPLVGRLSAALAVSAVLWAIVLIAMR